MGLFVCFLFHLLVLFVLWSKRRRKGSPIPARSSQGEAARGARWSGKGRSPTGGDAQRGSGPKQCRCRYRCGNGAGAVPCHSRDRHRHRHRHRERSRAVPPAAPRRCAAAGAASGPAEEEGFVSPSPGLCRCPIGAGGSCFPSPPLWKNLNGKGTHFRRCLRFAFPFRLRACGLCKIPGGESRLLTAVVFRKVTTSAGRQWVRGAPVPSGKATERPRRDPRCPSSPSPEATLDSGLGEPWGHRKREAEGGSEAPAWAGRLEAVAFPEPDTCEAVSEHRFCSEGANINCFAQWGLLLCRAAGIRGWLVCCEIKRGFKARK